MFLFCHLDSLIPFSFSSRLDLFQLGLFRNEHRLADGVDEVQRLYFDVNLFHLDFELRCLWDCGRHELLNRLCSHAGRLRLMLFLFRSWYLCYLFGNLVELRASPIRHRLMSGYVQIFQFLALFVLYAYHFHVWTFYSIFHHQRSLIYIYTLYL